MKDGKSKLDRAAVEAALDATAKYKVTSFAPSVLTAQKFLLNITGMT